MAKNLTSKTATVLAFDPGGTTGWATLTVPAIALIGSSAGYYGNPPMTVLNEEGSCLKSGPLHLEIINKAYGEIDCGVGGFGHELAVGRSHGELNIAGEIDGIQQMIDLACFPNRDSAIVLEEFTLEQSEKHTDLLLPVRIMAGFWNNLALIHEEMNDEINRAVERIFINRRVDAKTVVTDARLRHFGLYDRNSGGHARDAMRHAYHFLRRARGVTPKAQELRWKAWPHLFEDPMIGQKPKKKREQKLGERIEGLK